MKHAYILTILLAAACGLAANDFQELAASIGPEAGMLDPEAGGMSLTGALGFLIEEDPTTGGTDVYLQMGVQPEFSIGPFGVGLELTFSYNVETSEWKKTEYNEDEDWLRIIRYVRYGENPYESPVYMKAGALDNATLGHGFILSRYRTNVDYDNRKAGLQVNLNYDYFSVETFTNNLFLGEVIGVRGTVRPWAGNEGMLSWFLKDIGFGITYATDRTAPYLLQDDWEYITSDARNIATGNDPAFDKDDPETWYWWKAAGDGLPDWDDNEVLLIEEDEAMSITGLDAEVPALRGDMLDLTFYVDYAQMANVGSESGKFSSGLGAGFLFNFKISESNKLYLKVEQRWIDRNFMPGYFDRLYEIERVQYATDFPLMTKMGYLETLPTDGSYKGIYAEAALKFLGMLEVWGTYTDNQDVSNDGALMIGAGLVKTMGFKAAAEYTKRNILDDDINDIFIMDDRSLFMAYVSYQLNSFIEVGTIFRREWELDLTSGEYEPVDSYSVGASFTTSF